MASYNGETGSQEEILVYSDECMVILDSSKLDIDINASNYYAESHISNYIQSVFTNLNTVLNDCKTLISSAKEYISVNSVDIPENTKLPDLIDIDFSINMENNYQAPTSYDNNKNIVVCLNDVNSSLNLRSGGSMDANIIGSLSHNTKLMVIDDGSNNSDWVKVQTEDGKVGYVSTKYVGSVYQMPTTSPSFNFTSNASVSTKTTNLNLRSGPGIGNSIVGSLGKGEDIEVVNYNPNSSWIKVKTKNGQEGYVYSKYVKVNNEA